MVRGQADHRLRWFHGSAAGLHLTITLADGLDDIELAGRCLAAGVKVQPLSWHRQADGPPGLVLGYSLAASDGQVRPRHFQHSDSGWSLAPPQSGNNIRVNRGAAVCAFRRF